MEPQRTPVWLDCDPGHDDAFAIILAGHSPCLKLLGISTVSGNLPVSTTTANALRVCNAVGLSDVPVVEGSARPLVRKAVYCESIHGQSGLDALGSAHLPPVSHSYVPIKSKAISFMFDVSPSKYKHGASINGRFSSQSCVGHTRASYLR